MAKFFVYFLTIRRKEDKMKEMRDRINDAKFR
jgi:preprotein translocase subunit YajC